jgi:hypothetical protein
MIRRRFARIAIGLVIATFLGSATWLVSAADGGEPGHWYKGNTHAHTFWSDGDEFPEMVAHWYKSHGYDFLAISDHNRLMAGQQWVKTGSHGRAPDSVLEKCRKQFGPDWLVLKGEEDQARVQLKTFDQVRAKLDEPGKFLLIQNEEISASCAQQPVHMNAINLAEPIAPASGVTVAETLKLNLALVREQASRLNRPILFQMNHPNFGPYAVSAEALAFAASARLFEVSNGHPGVHNLGDALHPGVEKLWDVANTIRIALMKAPPLLAVGSDDAHNYQNFAPTLANPGRAWIMVHANQPTAPAILDAIAGGDFYASSGVTLKSTSFDADKQTVSVEVQPEPGVQYTIEFVGTLEGTDPKATIIESENGKKLTVPGVKYSAEIGKVLSSVKGTSASYRLTGKELYVRAVVRSDKPIANAPPGAAQLQQAWCQPVGWEH